MATKVGDGIAERVVTHLGSGPVSLRLKWFFLRVAGARVGWPLSIDSGVWLRQAHHFSSGSGLVVSRGTVINCSTHLALGRDCLLGYGSFIGTAAHRIPEFREMPVSAAGHEHRSITLGDGVWVGAHACVLPGVQLGQGCVVGAGAVVTKSAPPGSVLVGVPARVTRTRVSVVESRATDEPSLE